MVCVLKMSFIPSQETSDGREGPAEYAAAPAVSQNIGCFVADSQTDDEDLVLPPNADVLYNMRHSRRGRILVICNSKFDPSLNLRPRSESAVTKDIEALENTFKNTLKFEWTLRKELTGYQMFDAVNEACNEDHSERDCILIVVSTHGKKGVIYGTDEEVKIEDLVEPLKYCEGLAGKPKLIFIQACRGTNLDKGIEMFEDAELTSEIKPSITIPVEADCLYAYSTADGYVSFNTPDKGSWFIQALCAEFSANWRSLDIIQMLTRVCHKLAFDHKSHKPSQPQYHRLKQVSSVTTTLTKTLYFPSS